jgi:hypothetical protein
MAFSPCGFIFPEAELSACLPGRNGPVAITPRRNGAIAVAQGGDCRGIGGVGWGELNGQRRKHDQKQEANSCFHLSLLRVELGIQGLRARRQRNTETMWRK